MPSTNLFTPGNTVSLTTATNASGNVALATGDGNQVRIKNIDATALAFVAFGTTSTMTAYVTSGMPIGPGDIVGVTVPSGVVYAAGIASIGTPILYFTRGAGT